MCVLSKNLQWCRVIKHGKSNVSRSSLVEERELQLQGSLTRDILITVEKVASCSQSVPWEAFFVWDFIPLLFLTCSIATASFLFEHCRSFCASVNFVKWRLFRCQNSLSLQVQSEATFSRFYLWYWTNLYWTRIVFSGPESSTHCTGVKCNMGKLRNLYLTFNNIIFNNMPFFN